MEGSHVSRRHFEGRRLVHGEPLKTFALARTCAWERCTTHLSRYNPSPWCAEHRGWREEPKKRVRRNRTDR